MKNYVEIVYEYESEPGWRDRDVWFAVRPSSYQLRAAGGEWKDGFTEPWTIGSGRVDIYSRNDIEALRDLLNAIEAEFEEEGK